MVVLCTNVFHKLVKLFAQLLLAFSYLVIFVFCFYCFFADAWRNKDVYIAQNANFVLIADI